MNLVEVILSKAWGGNKVGTKIKVDVGKAKTLRMSGFLVKNKNKTRIEVD